MKKYGYYVRFGDKLSLVLDNICWVSGYKETGYYKELEKESIDNYMRDREIDLGTPKVIDWNVEKREQWIEYKKENI